MKAVGEYIYPTLGLLMLLGTWEVGVRWGEVPTYILPQASEVASEMVRERALLLEEALVTLRVILGGYAIAVLVSIPLAAAIVAWRPLEQSIYPLLVASQVIPLVAVAPIIIVMFGFGMTSHLLIVFLIAFFPIIIDAIAGLRSLPIQKVYLGKSMGASDLQIFRKIRFPHALPEVFTGLKLAATFAVVGAVIAEFVGSEQGLGRLLLVAAGRFDTVLVAAGIGYLTAMGIALFYLVEVTERLVVRGRPASALRGTL